MLISPVSVISVCISLLIKYSEKNVNITNICDCNLKIRDRRKLLNLFTGNNLCKIVVLSSREA